MVVSTFTSVTGRTKEGRKVGVVASELLCVCVRVCVGAGGEGARPPVRRRHSVLRKRPSSLTVCPVSAPVLFLSCRTVPPSVVRGRLPPSGF